LRFARAGYYEFPLYATRGAPQKPYGWARNTLSPGSVEAEKAIAATCDPDEVITWEAQVSAKYSGAKVVGYGILGIGKVIFDLDCKDGKDGRAEFTKLVAQYKIPNPTLVVKSKSGGFHLFYDKPEGYEDRRVKTLSSIIVGRHKYEGVDVRGDGGMVVGASILEEGQWQPGYYAIDRGNPEVELPKVPAALLDELVSRTSYGDHDTSIAVRMEVANDTTDVMAQLRRGELPKLLPRGQRNEGFFVFINALRNKGFSQETILSYCRNLVAVTEGADDLSSSVDIQAMVSRAFAVDINNPHHVARDLLHHGLYRLTGHGSRIKYTCLEPNPYIQSTGVHDLTAMTQLLATYAKRVLVGKKEVNLNPATQLDVIITPSNEVDTLGFMPGAPEVFTSIDQSGWRFLNTWKDPRLLIKTGNRDDKAIDEFLLLVSRIFGNEGSKEFQLGLDFPAWMLQKPGVKPVIVPFVQSLVRGGGKSQYLNTLRHLYGMSKVGEFQARTIRIEDIGARFFNPSGAVLLMLDEVQFPTHRDMRKEATNFWKHLKTLSTAGHVTVEIKGGGVYEMPNLSGIIMTGNTNNHFPIEENDRRVWMIDNNPPELTPGTIDSLFDLDSIAVPSSRRAQIINSIRWYLMQHPIKMPLNSMRAPESDLKREMYLSTLTDLEAWFIEHFSNPDNMSSSTPVVTLDMVRYVMENCTALLRSKWREDLDNSIRELRRRGLLISVKTPTSATTTRQISSVPNVTLRGIRTVSEGRVVLYTTRAHGSFNSASNEELKVALESNVRSIETLKIQFSGAPVSGIGMHMGV
jgi:hypothetical protein